MSSLNPGGQRTAPFSRIFGFEAIKRACKPQINRCHSAGVNSIAAGNRHGGAHEHKREIARHLRQRGAVG